MITNQHHFCSMNNKLSTAYLILNSVFFFLVCGGSAKEENKNR